MRSRLLHVFLITIAGIIIYSNTLNAPFMWDDNNLILRNANIRTLSNFTKISGTRYLTFLSFALNYRINGYDVTGYHIFNIAVHILNALLVYWLVSLTLKALQYRNSGDPDDIATGRPDTSFTALFSGLLFACHPVYTMAVTNINQRSAPLATLFYLLSAATYIKWKLNSLTQDAAREPHTKKNILHRAPWIMYLCSLLSAVFAMKCKEISFTLPIVIFLFDRYFFGSRNDFRKSVARMLPILLTLLIIPLSTPQPDVFSQAETHTFRVNSGSVLSGLDVQKLSSIPRKDYMITELRVIATYLRLFFLPLNLNYDYDYPVYRSFLSPNVLSSFFLISALLIIAAYFFIESGGERGSPALLVPFGIFWFFVTISLESFVVVLNYVIFEYRLYLPSVGIILSLCGLTDWIITRFRNKLKHTIVFIVTAIVLLSAATYERNEVLKNTTTLWTDVIKKSPLRSEAYNNLGLFYFDQGQMDKAAEEYKNALKINPNHPKVHLNLGLAYYRQGRLSEAVQEYLISLKLAPNDPAAHYNLALAYYNQGKMHEAIGEYLAIIKIIPNDPEVYNNLANAYATSGYVDEAIRYYKAALEFDPSLAGTHNNLGLAYKRKGLKNDALREFQTALKIQPDLFQARQNIESLNIKNK